MVPAIEGDRAGRTWVKLWGDWLYRVNFGAIALPLRDMGSVYHVHRLTWGGGLLLSPCVRWPGLLVIVLDL